MNSTANITAYTAFLMLNSALSAQASALNTTDEYYCRVESQGFIQGILGNGDLMATIIISALIGGALSAPIYVLIGRRFNRRANEGCKDDNGGTTNAS